MQSNENFHHYHSRGDEKTINLNDFWNENNNKWKTDNIVHDRNEMIDFDCDGNNKRSKKQLEEVGKGMGKFTIFIPYYLSLRVPEIDYISKDYFISKFVPDFLIHDGTYNEEIYQLISKLDLKFTKNNNDITLRFHANNNYQDFKCHKIILLSSAETYFAPLVKNYSNIENPIVHIHSNTEKFNLNLELFNELIYYMYNDKLSSNYLLYRKLLLASIIFGMDSLKEICLKKVAQCNQLTQLI
jgi:hypothetical protein